jgi:hypothetical protein
MRGVGASMPKKNKKTKKKTKIDFLLGIWGVEGEKCWDSLDVRGAKECQGGNGGLWRGGWG